MKVAQSYSTLCNLHGLHSPWDSPGQNTGAGSFSLPPGDLPNPEIKPRSPALQADSLPAEPQGKPKNTGVGNLSLPQWIFLTQVSNRGLLHCRQVLYRLSYRKPQHHSYHQTLTGCSGPMPASSLDHAHTGSDLQGTTGCTCPPLLDLPAPNLMPGPHSRSSANAC